MLNEVDISEILKNSFKDIEAEAYKQVESFDDLSKPIPGQDEPLITCCFVNDNVLFVNVFHRIPRI